MSTTPKPLSGSKSEVSRFKLKWRDEFSDAQRQLYWSLFFSGETLPAVRKTLLQRTGINLIRDNQLSGKGALMDWVQEQMETDAERMRQQEDEYRFKKENPDITEEELRKKVLRAYYHRAMARGEPGLGKAMMKQDLAERKFQFEQDQAAETKKSDQQKALELCLTESKSYPEIAEQFKQAFAALKKAKGSK